MFNDFFSEVAGLSPDTLSSSLQPYGDRSDFFINTASLAVVIPLPIKKKRHSIDKNYLQRREDLNLCTVKDTWEVVKKLKYPIKSGKHSSWATSLFLRQPCHVGLYSAMNTEGVCSCACEDLDTQRYGKSSEIIAMHILKNFRTHSTLFFLFSCEAIRPEGMTDDKDHLPFLALRSGLVTHLARSFP